MYILNKINDIFYKESHYYLYGMTFYHLLLILFGLLGVHNLNPKVFFVLDFSSLTTNIFGDNSHTFLSTILFTLIIMFVDLLFFIIIMYEFDKLKLTMKKIFILEIVVFLLSVFNPVIRMSMLFLSLNTLQITFFYKFITYIPFSKYVFLTVCYIIIIRLILTPIMNFYNLYMLYG